MTHLIPIQHFAQVSGFFLIRKVSCLVTMNADLESLEDSTSPARLAVQRNVDVVIEDGKILRIGKDAGMEFEGRAVEIISGTGLVVMPGLVDAYASPLSLSRLGKNTVMRSQGVSSAELETLGISGQNSRKQSALPQPLDGPLVLGRFLARAKNQGVLLQEVKTGYTLTTASLREQWQMLCFTAANVRDIQIRLREISSRHSTVLFQ